MCTQRTVCVCHVCARAAYGVVAGTDVDCGSFPDGPISPCPWHGRYVAADAHLPSAARWAVDVGRMHNAGQSCCATKRLLVHQVRYPSSLPSTTNTSPPWLFPAPIPPHSCTSVAPAVAKAGVTVSGVAAASALAQDVAEEFRQLVNARMAAAVPPTYFHSK